MTATNHALTGTAIGLLVSQPLVALPLALASHFICDAIPHYGSNTPNATLKTKIFRNYLLAEALICFMIVLMLFLARPPHWQTAAICAFLAAAPDLVSIGRYVKIRSGKPWHSNLYTRFAARIQWFEKPIGAVIEAAWFSAMLIILIPIIY